MIRNVSTTNTAVENETKSQKKAKRSVRIIVEHEYVGKKSAKEMFSLLEEEQIRMAVNENFKKAG